LFLHGFLGSYLDWQGVIDQLKSDYYCLAINIKHADYNQIFSFVENVLTDRCIDKCHLIGYSMGGRLAFCLATRYPDSWDKVVIESATPGLKSDEEIKERKIIEKQWLDKLKVYDIEKFISEWYDQAIFSNIKMHQNFESLYKRRISTQKDLIIKNLTELSILKMPECWNKLKSIKNEMLFIAGEFDKKYIQIGMDIVIQNSYSKLKIVPQSGHNTHFENEKEFINCVKIFLSGRTY